MSPSKMPTGGAGEVSTRRRAVGRPGHRSALAVLLALSLSSCAVNPATGERQLSLLSESQEVQLGREADPEIVASMGLYPDEALQAYVQALGARLAARSERPELPWTFRVLDDPLINAFALPGGYIYVTRGIMAYLESEAELVGVLGHEIGHVTARHSVHQISRAQLAQIGWGLGTILEPRLQRFEPLASASMQLLFLKFGRDDERQADALGVRYMGRGGYDPRQLSGVMGMLSRVTRGEGGGGMPEWLSTHPDPANREEAIARLAVDAEVSRDPPLVDREGYLRRLEGLVFGHNPREGYFTGATFFHPDLRFRMEFPEGWETRNGKRAVQAVSPRQDAVLVLTASGGTDPRGALEDFLRQEGLSGERARETERYGITFAEADFRYSSSEGTLAGRVSFLSLEGSVFRLLGYAGEGSWSSYRSVVAAAMASVRPLTDPAALSVQPVRLHVVTLSAPSDLQSVLEGEGAARWLREVQLLNRLEGNPTLPAGRILKIPIGELPPPR